VVGLVGLAQVPTLLEFLGIGAVVAAVALRSRDGDVPAAVGRTGG
jgi:inner membrane transporter RhtA